MESPFADCEAKLVRERTRAVFRGEEYDYYYSFYECELTGERFTTSELDEVNVSQIYNQYREKHNIPFPDEIKAILSTYSISVSKLTAILGFGDNQISRYIKGEMPSKANGTALSVIRDIDVFLKYAENAVNMIGEKSLNCIRERAIAAKNQTDDAEFRIIFRKAERSISNGFAVQELRKLKDVIMYALLEMGDTFITKMNKILFYCDMLSYRQFGKGLTGLAYKSEQYGIIPFRSNQIYSLLNIPQISKFYGDKEVTPLHRQDGFVISTLDELERNIISDVCHRFASTTSKEISEINHKEEVWSRYLDKDKPIPYYEAFDLTQI